MNLKNRASIGTALESLTQILAAVTTVLIVLVKIQQKSLENHIKFKKYKSLT